MNGSTERCNCKHVVTSTKWEFIKGNKFEKAYMSKPSARGVRCGAADHLLGLRVRICLKVRTYVSCECCSLSVKGLCDGPIFRQEESFEYVCVCVCVCVSVGACACRWVVLRKKNWLLFRSLLRYKDWSKIYKLDALNRFVLRSW